MKEEKTFLKSRHSIWGAQILVYLNSEDPFYSEKVESNTVQWDKPIIQKPTKKKDDSIISKKVLVIFAIVAIIKVSILLLWLI